MLTRIDHVMICVPDLQQGAASTAGWASTCMPAARTPGKGTHNAIALNEQDYIELLAVRDAAEYRGLGQGGYLEYRIDRFHRRGRRHTLRGNPKRQPRCRRCCRCAGAAWKSVT